VPRIYKIQRQGGSYYLALPPFLVTEEMLEHGVTIDVLKYDQKTIFMTVSVANRKHNKDNQNNRENTSESRLTNNVRKTD